MDPRDELIAEIAAFLAALKRPMAESTFGRLAVNDGKLVERLRARRNVTLDRIAKARRFMAERRGADHQESPTP